jgi:hypothetical protein
VQHRPSGKVERGYDFITREALFYKDPVTDQILDTSTELPPVTGRLLRQVCLLVKTMKIP